MFIAIVGTRFSGKSSVEEYLITKGFTSVRLLGADRQDTASDSESLEEKTINDPSSPVHFKRPPDLSLNSTNKKDNRFSFLSLGSPTSASPFNPPGVWSQAQLPQVLFASPQELLVHVTQNWRNNFVTTDLNSQELLQTFIKRPFFMLISVDAPLLERFRRAKGRVLIMEFQYLLLIHRLRAHSAPSLEIFVQQDDKLKFATASSTSHQSLSPYHSFMDLIEVHVVNSFSTLPALHSYLDNLRLLNPDRLRPGWDTYFMTLATLASRRSNCMKRRVGAVLVRDNRIVATGYNGTARGLKNCNEGGCDHCNNARSSLVLHECVCLHAEENALLEAGRERIGDGAALYCNTCPCLKCTVKIIQTGIKEVVYNLSYKVDDASAKLFDEAGVILRKHDFSSHLTLPALAGIQQGDFELLKPRVSVASN